MRRPPIGTRPAASVDLRGGGNFSSRMEAKDGSIGFDFAGTYPNIMPQKLIEYAFGERTAQVEFARQSDAVVVRITFEAETTHSVEQQRGGWQAILDNFARYVEGRTGTAVCGEGDIYRLRFDVEGCGGADC